MTWVLATLLLGGLALRSAVENRPMLDVLRGIMDSVPGGPGEHGFSTSILGPLGGGGTKAGSSAPPTGHVHSDLTPGRIDQGMDFSGVGKTIPSPWSGTVKSASHPTGWPGSGGLLIKFDQPIQGAHYGFIYEDVRPRVSVGQRVRVGQPIATVAPGSSGIEIGFSDAHGVPLAHAGYTEGEATAWGHKISSYLHRLGWF